MKKAFLLDRDGTINVDSGYVGAVKDVKLLPGAGEAIRRINQAGYLAIVVSNQSGVARGYFDINAVDQVNRRLNELLAEYNAHIDVFYYCPHLKNAEVAEFAVDCDCRKPRLGMFRRAIEEYELNPAKCYACGDKLRDVENLTQLGLPAAHLGVLQENEKYSSYDSLLSFVNSSLLP